MSMNMPKSTVTQFLRKQTPGGDQQMEGVVENPVKTLKTLDSIKDENERVVVVEEHLKSQDMEKADVDHMSHPSYVAEYVKDIFEYLKQNEVNIIELLQNWRLFAFLLFRRSSWPRAPICLKSRLISMTKCEPS